MRHLVPALALTLSAVGGCASLPRIVPDLGREPVRQVRIEDAHGPLSIERSKQVLEELKGRRTEPTVFDRHLALEQALVETPLLAGNSVKLLQDGDQTYASLFDAIHSARDSINLETYIFDDDEVGQRVADALIERQKSGVQVNVICDAVGTLRTKKEFFDRLRSAGVLVVVYNPVNPLKARAGWDVNERDHRKLLVVDGHKALLGGINISGVYVSGSSASLSHSGGSKDERPWRDTDVQVEGPVVAELQKLFMQTWQQQKGPPLPERNYFPRARTVGKEVVRAVAGSPEEPYSQIYATLISAIQNAESEILITNAYFAPDPQLLKVLKDAAARGVKVQMVLPSHTDSWLVFNAGRAHYEDLLRGGVQIFERKNALLHAKTALIDGVWSTVGSTNLDWRSFLHNQELNAVVLGEEFGRQMRAAFERDLAQSRRITLEDWERRPLSDRMKESLGRLWEYWL